MGLAPTRAATCAAGVFRPSQRLPVRPTHEKVFALQSGLRRQGGSPVGIKDTLLPEFDHEMGVTRKLLERLPDADLGWKPHDKSFTLGQLAAHLVQIPRWSASILDEASYDLASGPDDDRASPTLGTEVVAAFDQAVVDARARLVSKSDAELMAPWTLKKHGQEVFTAPAVVTFKSFIINHSIHHRGQLSVYLRLKNVPLPSIYGPSADEPM